MRSSAAECPACGSAGRPYLQVRAVRAPFRVLRCPRCGTGFSEVEPAPAAGAEDAPYPHLALHRRRPELFEREARRYLRVLGRIARPQSLLDVGCGPGFFLQAAQQAGIAACGIDLSRAAIGEARTRAPGARLFVGRSPLEAAPGELFDAVTMWNSLEHQYDPLTALRAGLDRVRPGGHLALEVPVDDALVVRLHHLLDAASGGRLGIAHALYGRDEAGHLVLFTEKAFRLLEPELPARIVHLERSGSQPEEVLDKHGQRGLRRLLAGAALRALDLAAGAVGRQNRLDVVWEKASAGAAAR